MRDYSSPHGHWPVAKSLGTWPDVTATSFLNEPHNGADLAQRQFETKSFAEQRKRR